jgi:repressor LexA
LGLTQEELASKLQTTRMTITRYEAGTRRIPGVVEVILRQLSSTPILPLVGVVAAGRPIEPVLQAETVDVPASMLGRGESFGLRIKGESMRDDGILPGDIIIVRKQASARTGQLVVALLNGEATIKQFYRKDAFIELRPANSTMEPIVVSPTDHLKIEGIVTGVIRHCE